MNATPASSQPAAPAGLDDAAVANASCRGPLFVLFIGAAIWLLVASALSLIASIKFHSPNFLAGNAWLTYGRVHAAAVNAQLYGFAIQAGLGVALWIIARLGGNPVSQPWLIAVGGKIWNIGVFIGLVGILAGDSTGFENFEMPRYAAFLLFLGYLLVGLWILLTLHWRNERRLEPPQTFLVAALLWFPWILSTAILLLTVSPVRGVMQPIIAWWYSANLTSVWLWLVGVAAVFYFLPQIAGRPLHSEYAALFAFWTIILFASWSGVPPSAPVPAWIPTVSTIATVLTIVPVLSVAVNLFGTARCPLRCAKEPPGRFICFGALAFLLSGILKMTGALPHVGQVTNLTWFGAAQAELNHYGFFAMVMFGAIYIIVPQVTGIAWPWPRLVRWQLWAAGVGILLSAVPLVIGGIVQGIRLGNPAIDFSDVVKSTLPFLRVSTVGELLMVFGHALLLANLAALSVRYYRTHFIPVYESALAEMKAAEVKP